PPARLRRDTGVVDEFFAIGFSYGFGGCRGQTGIIGVKARDERWTFRRSVDEKQTEGRGLEVDRNPAATAHGIRNGQDVIRLRLRRGHPDETLPVAEKGFRGCADLCVFQMMPLLIAVAIAMARLLAANF